MRFLLCCHAADDPDLPGKPASTLTLFFGMSMSQQTNEVALYSFGDIVGAVGGSLGLFLGFSCFDSWRRFLLWSFRDKN